MIIRSSANRVLILHSHWSTPVRYNQLFMPLLKVPQGLKIIEEKALPLYK